MFANLVCMDSSSLKRTFKFIDKIKQVILPGEGQIFTSKNPVMVSRNITGTLSPLILLNYKEKMMHALVSRCSFCISKLLVCKDGKAQIKEQNSHV